MTFAWSLVLLASVAFAVAGPLFFGHALVEKDSVWYAASGVCLLIAAALFFVQARFAPGGRHPSQH